MNAILFGIMVALALFLGITCVVGIMGGDKNAMWFSLASSICTGIAAGMVYGGGV